MSTPAVIRRPPWWRILARRRWEHEMGDAPAALHVTLAVKRRKPRSLKGVVGR